MLAVLHGYLDASGGRQDPDLVGWGYRDPSVVQPEPLVLIHHDRIVAVLLHIEMPEADKCFTRGGIRLGSLKDAIRAAYGDPPSSFKGYHEEWVYNALGVVFDFDPAYSSAKQWPTSAVTAIEIFQPGQFCGTLDLRRKVSFLGIHTEKLSCAQYAPPP